MKPPFFFFQKIYTDVLRETDKKLMESQKNRKTAPLKQMCAQRNYISCCLKRQKLKLQILAVKKKTTHIRTTLMYTYKKTQQLKD